MVPRNPLRNGCRSGNCRVAAWLKPVERVFRWNRSALGGGATISLFILAAFVRRQTTPFGCKMLYSQTTRARCPRRTSL